jgi:predicted RNA polymerase sigma factor
VVRSDETGSGDVDVAALRTLAPEVLSVLVRRGADPKAWMITVAWRSFLDLARSESARRGRELRVESEPAIGAVPDSDDTLQLYFLCAHPALTSASAVALTLRSTA